MNRILIATLSFNRQPYTKRFIESLFNGTNEPFDLVIIEQGSAKPAKDFCKYLEGKKTENGSNIRVIWNEENVGIPIALNQALSLRQPSQHFMKIDNDVIIPNDYHDWLSNMIEIVENHREKDPIKIIGLSPYEYDRKNHFQRRHTYLTNGKAYEIEDPCGIGILEMGVLISEHVINRTGEFDKKGLLYGYEGASYWKKTPFKKVYFHNCRAIHADTLDLLESNEHQALKKRLLSGSKDAKYISEQYSEDLSELKIKFKE
mgnify:CR=1 FL=1